MLNSLLPMAAASLTPLAHRMGQQIEGVLSFFDHLKPEAAEDTSPDAPAESSDEAVNPFAEALRRFHEQAAARLTAAGVDLSLPVEVAFNSQGQLAVVSAHPDLTRIENELNSDHELTSAFAALAEQHAALEYPALGGPGPAAVPLAGEFSVEFDATSLRVRQ